MVLHCRKLQFLSAKKIQKTQLRGYFKPFWPKFWRKLIFWEKKGLCHFLNIPIIYHHTKNHKKLMTHSWGERRTDSLTETWQFKQSELLLEWNWFRNHFQFLTQEFFYFVFLSENGSGRCWNPRRLELAFFPKSDKEFITWVWNSETCDQVYTRNESNKYFQSLVLTRVQHQNFPNW